MASPLPSGRRRRARFPAASGLLSTANIGREFVGRLACWQALSVWVPVLNRAQIASGTHRGQDGALECDVRLAGADLQGPPFGLFESGALLVPIHGLAELGVRPDQGLREAEVAPSSK